MEKLKYVLAAIEEDRRKHFALPVAERLKIDREDGVKSLLDFGYISPDEAQRYRTQLQELPTDRKELVVAYFLRGFYDPNVISFEDDNELKEFLHTFRLGERGYLPDEAIADRLSPKEQESLLNGFRELRVKSQLWRAEDFVDVKRRRMRETLLRSVRAKVAYALSTPPKKGSIDSNPYVREVAVSHGYRPKAKTIKETDRQAIETASLYYLDLLELAILNGEAERRITEVYPKFLSEDGSVWSEEFMYEDEFDEALTELIDLYKVLETSLVNFYNDGTPKDLLRFLKDVLSGYNTRKEGGIVSTDRIEEDLILGRLLNTKFKYLIEEGLC